MVSRMVETKSEYKMTEVGEIPIDWEVNKLKSIGKFSSGTGFPEKYQGGKDSKDIPFFKVSDMNLKGNEVNMIVSNNYVNSQAIAKIKAKVIDKKSIIFAKVGAAIFLERKRKVSSPFLIDNNMMAFSSDKSIDFNYLYYLFSRIRLSKYAQVGALPSYNASDIGNIKVAYPESSLEQQKIAEILSTVDEQIEQTDQLIEKTTELKKGLMQQLLTKGIGHTEFKQSELGEIPDNWEVKRLSEVTSIINGGTPSKNNLDYWDNGDILWATPTDITKNKSKYISNTEQKITKKGLKESSASLLPIGSILMTSRATIGARSINKIPMTTNQGFKAFICGEEVYNEFLYYYVEILIPIFLAKAAGSTFLEISKKNTEEQLISLPSIEEQKQIASILSSVDEDIVGYEQEKSQYEELKKGLMQQLLTGKKRVKVD